MGARTGKGGEEIGKEKETVETVEEEEKEEKEEEEKEEEKEDAQGVVETGGDHRLELCQSGNKADACSRPDLR